MCPTAPEFHLLHVESSLNLNFLSFSPSWSMCSGNYLHNCKGCLAFSILVSMQLALHVFPRLSVCVLAPTCMLLRIYIHIDMYQHTQLHLKYTSNYMPSTTYTYLNIYTHMHIIYFHRQTCTYTQYLHTLYPLGSYQQVVHVHGTQVSPPSKIK